MRRWLFTTGLAIGTVTLLGCGQQADQKPIELVDDSPVIGVWYLQAAGDRPVGIGSTIRFEFKPNGDAVYEHLSDGPEDPEVYKLTYNLAGTIISIDGNSEEPGVPRLTGMIAFEDEGKTLRINTHTKEDWLLTRDAKPGGAIEAARRFKQVDSKADPRLARVQHLAYASSTFAKQNGHVPTHPMDLIKAGLIKPEELIASADAKDLPSRYSRMGEAEQARWLDANSAYVFFFDYAGTEQSSSVVVSTLPENGKSKVVIGMANGGVYLKPAKEAAQLLQFQVGELPERWPDSAWSRKATAGLEPLSD